MTFEAQFKKLESILENLEEGDLSLDASLKEYEQGIGALRSCRKILDSAEQRIEELTVCDAPAARAGLQPAE